MKLIKVDDNGSVTVFDDILGFDFINVDDVQNVAENYGTKLTEEELEEFVRRTDHSETFPDYERVSYIVSDIVGERE